MEHPKMRRSTWPCNAWTIATIFVIFFIGLQAVQSKKLSHDNDIIFDDSPLDASEGQRFLHKRSVDSIDSDDNDEHWLWTHVNRIKRSIHEAIGSSDQPKYRAKRGWFDWLEPPKKEETTTDAATTTTTTTTEEPWSLFGNPKPSEEAPKTDEPRSPWSFFGSRSSADEDRTQSDNSAPEELSNSVDDVTDDGANDDGDDEDFEEGSSDISPIDDSTFNQGTERFFRLKFKVRGTWSPNYDDVNERRLKAREIEQKLEHLYDSKKPFHHSRNRIRARVTQIRRPSQNEIFNVGVNVDIISEEPIALDELEQIFGNALDSRKIDDLSVERDDYYELYAIQESELKQGDDIELVTANPNEGGGGDFEGSTDDYDFGTESTGEIDSAPDYPYICRDDEYLCDGSRCIPNSARCNGEHDCRDLTDEIGCPSTTPTPADCNDDEFRCDDTCISKESVCDGIGDCNDGLDEANCHCLPDEYECADGQCIDRGRLCDGNWDCERGDDEDPERCRPDFGSAEDEYTTNSYETTESNPWEPQTESNPEFESTTIDSTTCHSDQISCDGECYPLSIRCDGIFQCTDGIDEENCGRPGGEEQSTQSPSSSTQAPSVTCPVYKCPGEEVCFSMEDRCDGRNQCSDGYDEYGCPPIDGKCRDNEFKCNDNVCIPANRKCDRVRDCRDGSDENDCHGCSQDEFTCTNGECVSNYRKCDGRSDCSDGSDESYAVCQPKGCRPGEFQCHNGDCIHSSAYCNGVFDCRDYSDERYCPSTAAPPPSIDSHVSNQPSDRLNLRTYPNNQTIKERYIREGLEVVFQCRDEGLARAKVRWTRPGGRPLPSGSKDSNGRLEIPNIRLEHSGEYVCEAVGYPLSTPGARTSVTLTVERRNPTWDRPPTACSVNEATCMNGDCVPKSALCNGVADCRDGSDEASCSISNRCQPNEFKCRNNKCILKTWRCDGENDCEDNSDEEACSTSAPGSVCSGIEYQCRSGQCIPKSFECDSHVDCLDGTDEIGCTKPTVAQPPPPLVYLHPGDTFNITCKAVGVPTPLVLWRLNWGHIPEKCTTTSHAGYGVLTCPNIAVHDSGAYSCELLNSLGSEFVTPDTILNVSGDKSVCQNGYFNDKAVRPEDCINCFCFGVSTQCKSADLFTYALPPPVTSLTVVGVHGPWVGQRSITIGPFDKHDLIATRHGVQLRLANLPISGELPYYALPNDYLGNQLKSYGGAFRYDVEYSGSGNPNDAPDVILTGNGNTLVYRSPNRIDEGVRNSVTVSFEPGQWYTIDSRLASREEIMMTLANVENVLIRLQYIDTVQREVELLNIVMDSAGSVDRGLGSASLVEECSCPAGYSGSSCESCAPGYTRQESGAWLGRCVREEEPCRPGTYGDPYRKIPCRPCPCPSTGGNNFAQTCYLGPDGEPVCNCNRGYTGRRCEQCSEGFIGNPLLPGGSCTTYQPPNPQCDPRGTLRQQPDGRCECKEHVTGARCDQCSSRSFFLSPKWSTGCVECFCSGVTSTCTSSSLYRDSVRASFAPNRNEFSLITDFEAPEEADQDIQVYNNEALFRTSSADQDVFFWRLPSRFAGNKITSYGGNLNYTIRYVPTPGGSMSRNNAPDVVIRSENDITILHYRRDEVAPSSSQSYEVPILEEYWQRSDGNAVTRQYLLMALADVSDIFIKATYTTTTDEAALSHVTLDTTSRHYTGNSAKATEVEQCSCPQGHQGTSCEDCAPGFTRTGGGIYLGLCEPCNCNGHSDECDAETGVCHNCRDSTEGDHCELCANGSSGDATVGTPSDCSTGDSSGQITTCPPNVVGHRCDQCRQGTYNLDPRNPAGCTECFCSGVTRSCSASRLYRQQIPAIIFEDKFPLTNRIGEVQTNEEPVVDYARNKISNRISDGNTYYWSLPQRFLGNQLKSYGGYLSFSIENEADGSYTPDQDIIIRGNGLTLVWTRTNPNENRTEALLKESVWQSIDREGPKVASRADLLTVLSNLEAILVRASLREYISQAHLGDVVMDTAVQQNTGEPLVSDIEICRCPEGYTGTSCESCDHKSYRDVNDRSAGLLGVCKRCPCENADSCSVESNGNVICNCYPGYYGDRCTDFETTVTTERPRPPTITVIVSSPVIQIIDVGETVQLPCQAYHNIKRIPITVFWRKESGSLPERSYQDHGVLTITNAQHSDSGVYVCQAESDERFEQRVTITVGRETPSKPRIQLRPPYLDVIEYSPAEVECVAQSSSPVQYTWTRIDGELSPDAYASGAWLRFNKVQRSDSGDYQCIARNQYGDDTSLLRVFVRESNPEPTRPPTPPPNRVVTISPPNFNGRPGDVLVLTCHNVINVYAPLVWTKNGYAQMPGYVDVQNGVLTIHSARVEDSGRYVCTSEPSMPGQSIESVTQVVDVNIANEGIIAQPPVVEPLDEMYTVVQGTDFTVTCKASGNPYPTIQWKKIHEDLGSNCKQIGNSLTIYNAQPANRGIYQCTATSNGQSTETSAIIEIDPREAPVVEVYPREPQTVRIGESAMLSCRAIAGIPTPTVAWSRKDGAPLSRNIEEKYQGTILISDITFADAGQYECKASNIAGESSLTATINVQQAPEIRISPNVTELTLTEGDELRLDCFAQGSPLPSVQWTEPRGQTTEVLSASIPIIRTLDSQSTIHKYNIGRKDEGTYICHAKNDAGEDQKFITILIEQKRGDVGSYDKDEIIDPRPQQPDYRPTQQPDYNRPDYNRPDQQRPDYNRPDYNRPDYNRPDQQRPDYQRPDYNRPDYNRPDAGRPEQHITGVGDFTKISCQIENAQKSTSWRRQDGQPLPSNSTLLGSDLIIDYTERDAAGIYECILHEPHGDFRIAYAELIVVELPRITLYPEMPLTVRSGEQVYIYCNASGDEPISVNWHAEDHRPFPENVRTNGRYLEFFHITQNNAGRYYCVASNPHGNVTKTAEVIVHHSEIPDRNTHGRVQEVIEGETVSLECSESQSPEARFNWRREGGDLPRSASLDRDNRLIIYNIRSEDTGRYICIKTEPTGHVTQNYLDVVFKPQTESQPVAPYVQLEPARSYLHPGDSIVVDCKSSSPDSVVTWKRDGDRRLPSNIHQQGIQLIITNAQSTDAGRYICVCRTENGQEYESEYELIVETPPARNEIKPPQIEHAEAGQTVVLNCNPGQYANRYHWSRQQGHFSAGTEISNSDLRLENVQAKDAGTYICTASNGAQSIEIPITLVVTGAIPYFPQAPNSYLVFPKLEDSYMKFNFEVTFNPERENGLILYNGQKRGDGNYIALSLNDGYPEFRFDSGSGPVIVRAEKPIDVKTWHTIKVNKVRKEGFLLVDDQRPVAFPPTQRSGVELLENLYLGSVPNFDDIASSATANHEGFVGCISRLILKEREIELKQDATSSVGTTSCETCASDVCENDGVCLETQTEQGFTCVCKAGFTGKTCGVEGLSCSPGICGTGRCENTDIGIECYCPLNKTGDRCQYTEHLDESNLSFKDGSFAAFKTPKSTKLNIRFNVRPENNQDSVILYVAESDHANGDFAAVVIKDKHYEFRFNTGARIRPVVIRSAEEVDVNKWTSISLGRRHGEGFLKVGDAPQVTGKTIGPARSMYLKTHLYIGGYDKRLLLSKGVEVSRGFDGCISGLEVSTQKIDMIKSLLDGANIQNCGDTNEITNIDQVEEPAESGSECSPGYTGPNCDEIVEGCEHDPCDNNGICEPKGSSYVCNCPIHFTGDICQYSAPLEFSSQYKGNGFIELNSSALVKSADEQDILLALLFSTTEPNGLLAWYGQNKGESYDGQDFVALAVVDGYLEFSLRLDGEETTIKHLNTPVNDGKRHTAVLTRNANRATLELDNFSVYGETAAANRNYSHLPGNLFIGGAPDINTFTGNRYSQGFNGCINIVEGTDTRAINLYDNAVSGYNVLPCADNEENIHH